MRGDALLGDMLEAIHKSKLTAEEYMALGGQIDAEVGTLVARCKHKGPPAAAARKAVGVLNNYGRYFDDPQWKALTLK